MIIAGAPVTADERQQCAELELLQPLAPVTRHSSRLNGTTAPKLLPKHPGEADRTTDSGFLAATTVEQPTCSYLVEQWGQLSSNPILLQNAIFNSLRRREELRFELQ